MSIITKLFVQSVFFKNGTPQLIGNRTKKLLSMNLKNFQIIKFSSHFAEDEYKLKLEAENKKLQDNVERLKKELILVETANGKLQVPLPTKENNPAPKPTPVKINQVQQKPKVEGDNKKVQKKQKVKKEKKAEDKKAGGDTAQVDISRIDLRVGKIVEVKYHEGADSLYVEKMDVGEKELRNIVTGVRKHVTIEQMQGRHVIVFCNLKPNKIRGEISQGMVMCAASEDGKVEIIDPPAEAVAGDKIFVEGFTGKPDAQVNPKKKILEKILPDLKTNDKCEVFYKGKPLQVEGKGGLKSQTLKSAACR